MERGLSYRNPLSIKKEIIFTWRMYTTLGQKINDTEDTDLNTQNQANNRNDPLYKAMALYLILFVTHSL